MDASIQKFELYGHFLDTPKSKVDTNSVRRAFTTIASTWSRKINAGFHELFANLDALYEDGDDLADEIRKQAIGQSIKFIVAHGIYDIDEARFYETFMQRYDSWDEDFGVLAEQYEAIAERSSDLDAHRTNRRQSRRQWVGYGTEKAVYDADAKNLLSNIGHGVFNLMAKGVTAIGDSLKKDEIFKSPTTVRVFVDAADNLVTAAYLATLDAINEESPGTLHGYSNDEIRKSKAITENIEKGIIPEDALVVSAIKAISVYPYNETIYPILLRNFGGDQGRLDQVVEYFGMGDLLSEKQALLQAQLRQCDLSTVDSFNACRPELERYAQFICLEQFDEQCALVIAKIVARENQAAMQPATALALTAAPQEQRSGMSVKTAAHGRLSNADHKFYAAPDLPSKKIQAFLDKNGLRVANDQVVFFFDETVFGSGDKGVLVDLDYVYVQLQFKEAHRVALGDIANITISGLLNKKLAIAKHDGTKVDVVLTQSNNGASSLREAILGLVRLKSA
ncbi:hypothetical protein [Pseudomonas fontis]|uniref:Uncharacterized protein n=1 Tax=Pseudomonas fontis TaxID=2942633 RepID=A0ABT5NM98_9PSED|nr:hypothetical protein [Pseudomonas fontis]MDD0976624.1 hypothetical protein [Pseudomonas fontis]MDD0988972.1 hypothetical protein [Pseudomonas fontis]